MTTSHRLEPHAKKFATVNRKRMAYVELGQGVPVFLFLHGNPTSSYLWRNVMPEVAGLGRCLAVDLIGMGDSDKLEHSGPETYRFTTHREFLWVFIDCVIGRDHPVVLVVHDWGSALGFDWANHHRGQVKGIVYMEAIVRPLTWAEWPEGSRRVFQGLRSEAGEEMVLDKNMFVERVLPASILRRLEPAEMEEYRRPFAKSKEDRWPTLSWPREIPIDGEPAAVAELVTAYADWMADPEAVRQCRSRRDPRRSSARILPQMAQSDRSHGQRQPFHPRRFRPGDRPRDRRLDASAGELSRLMDLALVVIAGLDLAIRGRL